MANRNSRGRARKERRQIVVGVAWFDPAQWAKLKPIAADADRLDDTHEAWERTAERALQQLTAQGMDVRRVSIDVDALVQWCRAHNKPIDGKSRAEYTSLIVSGALPAAGEASG